MVVQLLLQLGVQGHRLGSHRRSTHGDRDGLQLGVQLHSVVCGIAREDVVYCASATTPISSTSVATTAPHSTTASIDSAIAAITTLSAAAAAATTATSAAAAAVGAGRLHGRGSAVQPA